MRFGLYLSCILFPLANAKAEPLAPAPFQSITLLDGGEVLIRHGDQQKVAIIQGNPAISVKGANLVIDNHGRPHRPGSRIEIVTPSFDGVSVKDGGSVRIDGGFPPFAAVAAMVTNGGLVDLRQAHVSHAQAVVAQGGRIAIGASDMLNASVNHGGVITYWGEPLVTQSIRDGGAIQKARTNDLNSKLLPDPTSVPQSPSVPFARRVSK